MTDMTVKTRKTFLRTYARTYAGKSFIHYPSYPSSVTLEDPLRRICNPTASSISICNALINNQETQNIFTHLKCLYSLRLDCKSNRARFLWYKGTEGTVKNKEKSPAYVHTYARED